MAAPAVFEKLLRHWNRAFNSPEWPLIQAAWHGQELARQLNNPNVAPVPTRDSTRDN